MTRRRPASTITSPDKRTRVCGQMVADGPARAASAGSISSKKPLKRGLQPRVPKRSLGELLTGFARVRAAWLDNAVTTMRLDDRYATAWLVGSLARGEEDVLSDIDMVAIFADDSASIVLADLNREFERFGHLLSGGMRTRTTRPTTVASLPSATTAALTFCRL